MCDAEALARWATEELNLKEKAFQHILLCAEGTRKVMTGGIYH